MLILSRKRNEAIYIGAGIVVRVLGIERDRVKLGVDAPKDIAVVREELLAAQYEAATEPTPIRKETE